MSFPLPVAFTVYIISYVYKYINWQNQQTCTSIFGDFYTCTSS
nr:MAG TPA: hypothetical protein [Caudoviricetes sp.]